MATLLNSLSKFCLRHFRSSHANIINRSDPYTCLFVQHRNYFDYESNLTHENQQFVYTWTKEKNAVLGSPLKDEQWERGKWRKGSWRTGLIAIKLGLFPMWTKAGEQFVTTAVQIQECQVVKYVPPGSVPKLSRFGFLYLGAKNASPLYRDEDYVEQFRMAGIPTKQRIYSFMITPEAALPPGMTLYAPHYRPGDKVHVCGRTMGKGFQGVMKRYGMKGQPASHGPSKTHRRIGALAARGPSKVWKGRKMPGNMGNRYTWMPNLEVMRVNTKHNIIFIKGLVPGKKGGFLMLQDTSSLRFQAGIPFPTYFPEDGEELPEDIYHDNVFQFSDDSIAYEQDADD